MYNLPRFAYDLAPIRRKPKPTPKESDMLRRLSTSLLAIIAILAVLDTIAPAQSVPLGTRHTREVTLSRQAPSIGRLPATHAMRLVIVLPLRNQDQLEKLLDELYDPSSPSYRQFLTVEEFTARFGPTEDDYDAVIRFAEANGLRWPAGRAIASILTSSARFPILSRRFT